MQDINELKVGDYFEIQGKFATTRTERRRGLRGKTLEEVHEPLIFEKCRSIHTFGMKFNLKVIFLDMDNRVLGIREVIPRRIVFAPKNTYSIVEIPAI